MAITKRPQFKETTSEESTENFIKNAPDAVSKEVRKKGLIRGKREQISHTLPPELLQRIDDEAKKKGLTRAGIINLAVSEYFDK